MTKGFAFPALAAVTLLSLVQHAYYWTYLPDTVATHFGIDGQPNAWMSKLAATILLCSLQIGMPCLFVGIAFALPKIPNSMINLPHREYWLAPERRASTLAHMTQMLSWFSVLIGLQMAAIVHLTFIANRSGEALNMTFFFVVMGAFLLAVGSVVFFSLRRFRLPKAAR